MLNRLMGTTSQPKGLYTLFFTELWERFGFYTLQTILILYLTQKLLFSDHHANILYAAFSALLYASPAVGGYLADRYLGFRRAIIIGGVLLFLGYVGTALPGRDFFYLGLSLLITGNGLLKPNVSSIVGDLYQQNDSRREGGFTLFYMGINLGSLIPPLIAGTIVVLYGWHAGFSLAAVGMAVGLITFIWSGKSIHHIGLVPKNSPLSSKGKRRFRFRILFYVGLLASVIFFYIAMQFPEYTDVIVIIAAVLVTAVVVVLLFREPLIQRNKMLASLILIIISIGFWALYMQTFTSLMLFAARNMDKNVLGFTITPEFTQFFNPFFIIMLSPALSQLWIRLNRFDKNPTVPAKFTFGIVFMSLGFILLAWGSGSFAHAGMVSAWWLIISYLLQTVGELLLSPIGLSMITLLSPKHLVGMMMGVWFFATAGAYAIGGYLASIADVPKHVGVLGSLGIYHHAFVVLSWLSIGLVVISFLLLPWLNKMILGKEEGEEKTVVF